MFKQLLFIITLLITSVHVIAQGEWKSWSSVNTDFGITKKFDAKLSHLRSYNLAKGFANGFNQTSGSLSYDATKTWTGVAGVMRTEFPSSASLPTYRYFTRVTFRFPLTNQIIWSNALQLEKHSSSETRFRNRYIYITRLSTRKRLPFLNSSLSAAYWLFYNSGGNKIRYYNDNGDVVARNSPDGFHRGRLYLTANSKLSQTLSVAVYYMRQQEFNLFSTPYRQIAVVSPTTGKVSREFDNYNVAGISLLFNFKLYTN